jgi:hypothetical protein
MRFDEHNPPVTLEQYNQMTEAQKRRLLLLPNPSVPLSPLRTSHSSQRGFTPFPAWIGDLGQFLARPRPYSV